MTKTRVAQLVLWTAIVVIVGACNPSKTINNNSTPPTPAPTIQSFAASPAGITFGDSTTLSWSVSNATSLSISPGVGTASGTSVSVSPANTTTYTLTASGSGGTANATTAVTVKTIATILGYTDPTSGTYKLVKNATKSTSTHMVLDLVGPAGSLSGVGFYLSADSTKVDWGVVDSGDTEKVKNSIFSSAILKSKATTDGVLQAGIYQKGTAGAVSATSSTVLASVALDLKSTATITNPRTVTFGAVSGKAVILNPPGSGAATTAISISTGTLTGS
jgi:hypothetical protein